MGKRNAPLRSIIPATSDALHIDRGSLLNACDGGVWLPEVEVLSEFSGLFERSKRLVLGGYSNSMVECVMLGRREHRRTRIGFGTRSQKLLSLCQ
jgi:hypothetical protein